MIAAADYLRSIEGAELVRIGGHICRWQASHGYNDTQLLRHFAELGSATTLRKIRSGDLENLDTTRQLTNYRTAWALMENGSATEKRVDDVFPDLSATLLLTRVFAETRRQTSLARCIFLLGPSGTGKTEAQRYLREKHGPRIISVRATVAWGNSPMTMMAALLHRLGVPQPPPSQAGRFALLVEKLNTTRRAVFIEDSHHLRPRHLALLIALIDETPGEFVVAAVEALWRRLHSRSFEELEQLRANRLAERIVLPSQVRSADVRRLIERRLHWQSDAEMARALPLLCEKTHLHGRLAFVRECIQRAQEKAGDTLWTAERFATVIGEEIASR